MKTFLTVMACGAAAFVGATLGGMVGGSLAPYLKEEMDLAM